MKPPTGGPMIGPSKAGMVSQAMASTSPDFGVVLRMISRPTGVIIAPPMPWRTRAATSSTSESDRAQAIEPAPNTTIAARKTVRAPYRSAIHPEAGMKIARERR